MIKIVTKIDNTRAYINPSAGTPEAEQKAIIETFGPISEWYVESCSITRDNFIKQLRPGDLAVVARTANLAVDKGNKMARVADLMDARGEIHARGAILVEASTCMYANKHWLKMKAIAIPMLGRMAQGRNSSLNGARGQPRLKVTDAEKKNY